MIFAVTLAGLHIMALAIAGADPVVGQSVFALAQAGLALAALGYGPMRRAMQAVLTQYWPAAVVFLAVIATTAWQAGMLGGTSAALNPFAAQTEVWSLAALFFAVLAPAAAAASSAGRRQLIEALLVAALCFAALDIGRKLQAGPEQTLLATGAQTAAIYAVSAIFAAFAAYDAIRSPSRDRMDRRVSMRLMLPGAALGAALLGVILCNKPMALGAMLAGLGAAGLGLALREWPRRLTFANGGFALAAFALATALFAMFGRDGDPFGLTDLQQSFATGAKGAFGLGSGVQGGMILTWLVEAGLWGAAALGLAGLILLARLAFGADRRKAPSRGFALALGVLVTACLSGDGAASPALTATVAILVGLAASYADALRKDRSKQRLAEAEPEPIAEEQPDAAVLNPA